MIAFIDTENRQILKETLDIDGVIVDVEIKSDKIKVAKGFIPIVSYSYIYDKNNVITDEQTIQNRIQEYIIDKINKKAFDIKTTKNMFVNSSLNDTFEIVNMTRTVKKVFGPLLYDTRIKKSVVSIKELSGEIDISTIKGILSAA